MANQYRTGEACSIAGIYIFDSYTDGTKSPSPTSEERVIQLARGATFPPIRSCNKGAFWTLSRQT